MLGLAKHLVTHPPTSPKEISFLVLDQVDEWGDTWELLKKAAKSELRSTGQPGITIEANFKTMDIVDPASYSKYVSLFGDVDVFVFNYLLSENQLRIPLFGGALQEIARRAKSGAYFLVIDRLEQLTSFRNDVNDAFLLQGLTVLQEVEIGNPPNHRMTDDYAALDPYLAAFGNRKPRQWFRDWKTQVPTVFALLAQKA